MLRQYERRKARCKRSTSTGATNSKFRRVPCRMPQLQTMPSVGQTFKRRLHYPAFCNMGNVCYTSSVLQCFLHCERARLYIRSAQVGAADDESSVRGAWKELTDRYRKGVTLGGCQPKFDAIAPYALWAAMEGEGFRKGATNDAAELFSTMLEKTGLGDECFCCGVGGAANGVLVLGSQLRAGEVDYARILPHDERKVNLRPLLEKLLGREDKQLRSIPQILVLKPPQVCTRGQDDAEASPTQRSTACAPSSTIAAKAPLENKSRSFPRRRASRTETV